MIGDETNWENRYYEILKELMKSFVPSSYNKTEYYKDFIEGRYK